MHTLTTYQRNIAEEVYGSVLSQRSAVVTTEMPLGAGVGELCMQLEMLVMTVNVNAESSLLRIVPAEPSVVRERLVNHLSGGDLHGLWSSARCGVRLGRSNVQYVSTGQLSAVDGVFTLVQVVDAHTLGRRSFARVLRIAEASMSTVVVFYGRSSSEGTPFELLKRRQERLQSHDGRTRHFEVTIGEVEAQLPGYAKRVASVRPKAGADDLPFKASRAHPPITTSYAGFIETPLARIA